MPAGANREYSTIDLINNSEGKLSLEYEYDFSIVVDADGPDIHLVASGDAGTGRMEFVVDKKFVLGAAE